MHLRFSATCRDIPQTFPVWRRCVHFMLFVSPWLFICESHGLQSGGKACVWHWQTIQTHSLCVIFNTLTCLFWDSTRLLNVSTCRLITCSPVSWCSADNADVVVTQTEHMDVKSTEAPSYKRVLLIYRAFHYLWIYRMGCFHRLDDNCFVLFFQLYTLCVINNNLWNRKGKWNCLFSVLFVDL